MAILPISTTPEGLRLYNGDVDLTDHILKIELGPGTRVTMQVVLRLPSLDEAASLWKVGTLTLAHPEPWIAGDYNVFTVVLTRQLGDYPLVEITARRKRADNGEDPDELATRMQALAAAAIAQANEGRHDG